MAKKRNISSKKKPVKSKKKQATTSYYNKVRKSLWSKYKHEYASYQDFMRNDLDENQKPIRGTGVASKVYNQLKSSKLGYSQQAIDASYKTFKKDTQRFQTAEEINERLSSALDYNLFEPNNYWEVGEEAVWDIIPSEVYAKVSKILPEPNYMAALLFQEDDRQRNRFTDWIDHLNSLQASGLWGNSTLYPAFKFTPVEWDSNINSWYTVLIPCTSSGDEEDWGWSSEMGGHDIDQMPDVFDFKDEMSDIDKELAEIEKLLGTEPTKVSKPTEAEIKAQITLEKEKRKTLKAKTKSTKEFNAAVKNIQSLLKDELIDKKTAKQMLKQLKP